MRDEVGPKRDRRDERDGVRHYAFLRARAPEGSTAKCVTVVTGNPVCCGGRKRKDVGGESQPSGGGSGGRQSLKTRADCRWRFVA
jgi:hypothetical protein